MGLYLNPANSGFTRIRNDIYVDKSGLISLISETIETPRFFDVCQQAAPLGEIICSENVIRIL